MSPAATRLTGFTPDEVLAYPETAICPDDPTSWADTPPLIGEPRRVRRLRKDGTPIRLEHTMMPVCDDARQVVALEGSARDVTRRVAAEAALRESEERYRTVVDTLVEGVIVRDGAGAIVTSNPAARAMLALTAENDGSRALAGPGWLLLHPNGSPVMDGEYLARIALRTGEPCDGIVGVRRPSGELRWIAIRSDVLALPGRPTMTVEVLEDVTEKRAAMHARLLEVGVRAALANVAESDPARTNPEATAQRICTALTGIPDVDGAAVVEWATTGTGTILAAAGLIESEADRSLSPEQTVRLQRRTIGGPWAESRAGGESGWATSVLGLDRDIQAVAGAPVREPGLLLGVVIMATRSAELAARLHDELPIITEFGARASLLLGPRLAERRRAALRHAALDHIIATRAFHPVLQPIVELESNEIVGYEALTRFNSGQRPDLCFSDAWTVGLGRELELVTIEAALAEAKALPAGRWLDLNVSPRLLDDPGRLRVLLRGAGRPVVLEVTEHEVIADYRAVREAVRTLGHDIRLAVDDAGAGVANFGHIVELRPDFVKLDISLVRRVNADLGRQALVVAMRHFAQTAGCRLIAEGVETIEEAETLAGLGVEFGQGYLFGHPEPVGTWAPAATAGRERA